MAEPQDDPELDRPEASEAGRATDLTSELVAYLDGELDQRGNEAIGARLSTEPAVRAEADALKKTWELLDYLPRPEPSPAFTERTIEKLEPVRRTSAGHAPGAVSAPTVAALTAGGAAGASTSRRNAQLIAGWVLAVAVAGWLGYFLHAQFAGRSQRLERQEQDARIPAELPLLRNLTAFMHVDDLAFLEALDNRELFGDDPGEGLP